MNMAEFTSERDEALLSLDEAQIRAYAEKYGARLGEGEVFWLSVHKARSALTSLPMEARRLSRDWLIRRGWKSLDEGDLS